MIKNKLYPYIEQYINEYLWGFTKEQIDIEVLKGTISLENMYLRPDIINNKLNNTEMPIWIKAGRIGKIKVSCTIMNLLGEKPLDVVIEDIDLILCPSYKYFLQNKRSPMTDAEFKQDYDPITFNSNNIFEKKIKIYDGSVLDINDRCNYYQDNTKLSKEINQLLTLCIWFNNVKPYSINAVISNIHIRYEDNELVYLSSSERIAFGLMINCIRVSLSSEGILKKNSFSIEELKVYDDHNPNIFIPTDFFVKALNKKGDCILESYYTSICKINLAKMTKEMKKTIIIELSKTKGTFGLNSIDKDNINLFENIKATNMMIVYFNLIIDNSLVIHLIPNSIDSIKAVIAFNDDYKTLKYVNEFKPLFAPLICGKSITAYFLHQNDSFFRLKKKYIIRDWLFYIFWFKKFKKAFEYSSYTNKNDRSSAFYNAFNRYMNIVYLRIKDIEIKELNEDIQIMRSNSNVKTFCINQSCNKDVSTGNNRNTIDNVIKSELKTQIKNIKVFFYNSTSHQCMINIDNNTFDLLISKQQCQCEYSFKHFLIETKDTYKTSNREIPKHENLINIRKTKQMKQNKSRQFYLYSTSSNTTASVSLSQKSPNQSLNITRHHNTDLCAGLKVSPLIEETQAIQKSNIQAFQQKAKSVRRMKVLCDTLKMTNNPIAHTHPLKVITQSQKKNHSNHNSFIMTLLNDSSEEIENRTLLEKEEEKLRTEVSISKAIKEYNNKKLKIINRSFNNSIIINQSMNQTKNDDNPNQAIGFLNKAIQQRNNEVYKSIFSIVNNKVNQIKEDFSLSLLTILPSDSIEYAFKLTITKNNATKIPDTLSLNLGNVRVNVFDSYLKDLFDIMQSFNFALSLKRIYSYDQSIEMKDKRYLFLMQKYIYTQCLKSLQNDSNPNKQLVAYTNFIRDNCMVTLFPEDCEVNQIAFDLNYFFSYYFREGLEINMNYNRIAVIKESRQSMIY